MAATDFIVTSKDGTMLRNEWMNVIDYEQRAYELDKYSRIEILEPMDTGRIYNDWIGRRHSGVVRTDWP